jgi:hypothetical protein
MMSAFNVGRYRIAVVATSCRITKITIGRV